MKKLLLTLAIIQLFNSACYSQQQPLEITKNVANYIIRNSPFQYKIDLFKPSTYLSDLQVINFGSNFGSQINTSAFSCTTLYAEKDSIILLELSHSGALQINLNGVKVYQQLQTNRLKYQFLERNVTLEKKVALHLRTGNNLLMFKSVCTNADDWKVLVQCTNSKIKICLPSLELLNASLVIAE